MSLIYYSRIRFIIKLMPLLLAAPDTAHVVAVYAAGLEGKLFRGDLSLRDPKHYGQIIVRSHNTHMTTMAFEHLAKQHQRVSLVHVFPGVVITPSYADPTFPMWFKILWRLLGPFVRRFQAISPEESSSRTLILGTSRFPARQDNNSVPRSGKTKIAQGTDGSLGSGAYAVGNDSEAVNLKADYEKLREEGFENTVWDHTMKAFSDIEAGRAFAE